MTVILQGPRARIARVPLQFRASDCLDESGFFARGYGQRRAGVLTRGSAKVLTDQAGVPFRIASGAPPLEWIRGEVALLLEPARTGPTWSADLRDAVWSNSRGTKAGVLSAGPDGRLLASAFIANTENNQHHVTRTQTATAWSRQAYVVELKYAGTHATVAIDSDGGINRIRVGVNLLTGAVVQAVASGTGVIDGYRVTQLADGYWRIELIGLVGSSTSLSWRVFTSPTGALSSYAGNDVDGVLIALNQPLADFATTSSRLPSSSGTGFARSTDACYFDVPALAPRALTIYTRQVHLGVFLPNGVTRRMVHIGANDVVIDPRFGIGKDTSTRPFCLYDDGTTAATAVVNSPPTFALDDIVEVCGSMSDTGTVTVSTAKNDGDAQAGTPAFASIVPAFTLARVYLFGGGDFLSALAPTHVTVAEGVRSMDEMRALAGVG